MFVPVSDQFNAFVPKPIAMPEQSQHVDHIGTGNPFVGWNKKYIIDV
jgi:hypothetical protein